MRLDKNRQQTKIINFSNANDYLKRPTLERNIHSENKPNRDNIRYY